jgi:lipid-binding SYLF domain-containing protein
MKRLIAAVLATGLCFFAGVADVDAQEETAEDWQSLEREARRMKINEMADLALKKVLAGNDKAERLYEMSYGWAAFDNLKLAFGFSGGGGNGVAVRITGDQRTYMKMGTVGIGLGLGANKYQVVFLFQDERTFTNFVESGWQADAGASAVAGKAGAEVKTDFVNGMAVYQVTDTGLMAHADIAGTKYWKNKNLNQ